MNEGTEVVLRAVGGGNGSNPTSIWTASNGRVLIAVSLITCWEPSEVWPVFGMKSKNMLEFFMQRCKPLT